MLRAVNRVAVRMEVRIVFVEGGFVEFCSGFFLER
jgi:hypothetical protein